MRSVSVVCPNLSGKGGTESVLKLFLEYSIKNYNFQLVLPYKSDNEEWLKNIDYIGIKKYSRFAIFNKINGLFFLFKFLILSKSNVYICLSTQLVFIVSLFRFIFRRKLIIISWIHFSLFNEKTVNIKFLKKADFHFAISSGIRRQMQQVEIDSEKIFTIYNPVKPPVRLNNLDQLSHITHFAYVGRVTYEGQKNLQELLHSICFVTGDWKLSIIGSGDGLDKCKQFVKENKLDNKVHFLGWVLNPWETLGRIDATILTSRYEGFPMVLLESMSRGIPCISSNCPTGPEDVIVNNLNGYLYDCGDTIKLAEIMQNIVNGCLKIDTNYVVHSISKFYIDEYIKNLIRCMDMISSKVN